MVRLAFLVGVVALASTLAVAQPAPVETETTATGAAAGAATDNGAASDNDPSKVICRNVKPPTGTRLASSRNRQRVCMTKAEWDDQAREAQEALKVRDSGVCSPGQCSG